jgi:ribosomal protein S18 acetylase RimI-like enzyme
MSFFDKSVIHIVVPTSTELILRSAKQSDMDYLRKWKNEQKQFFFYQEEITSNQQGEWYESFKQRPNDLMLMTEYNQQIFGCMGIRWKENRWDVYNVILGLQEFGGRGLMGLAFTSLLDLVNSLKSAPISLQVLRHNPALKWYQKQGFEITETHESFFFMTFQPKQSLRTYS